MATEEKLDLKEQLHLVEQNINDERDGQIVRICNAVVDAHPTNLFWLRLLCCASIHLGELRPMLRRIESCSTQLQNALLFYRIYAHYLLKKTEAARQILDENREHISALPDTERRATRCLEFQILYRLGSYESSLNALDLIDQRRDPDFHTERMVNRMSALIALGRWSEAVELSTKSGRNTTNSNCDLVFNAATAMIAGGRCSDALQHLNTSIPRCEESMRSSNDHDYSESEILTELAHLSLLKACCFHIMGETDSALEIYKQLHEEDSLGNVNVFPKLLVQHNMSILKNGDDEIFAKLLKMKYRRNLLRIGGGEQNCQALRVLTNRGLFLLRERAGVGKEVLFGLIRKQWPSTEIPLILKVADHLENDRIPQARDVLQSYTAKVTEVSDEIKLWFVECLLMGTNKRYRSAVMFLRSQSSLKFQERIIVFMLNVVTHKLNDNKLKIDILRESIAYFVEHNIDTEFSQSLRLQLCRLSEDKVDLSGIEERRAKAMAILDALRNGEQHLDLAEQLSSELAVDPVAPDGVSTADLLSEIPPLDNVHGLRFEIREDLENERKRAASRRQRGRKAAKLRAYYKEHPEKYKDPVDWTPRKKRERRDNALNAERKEEHGRSGKGRKQSKKKKVYDGAQGGTSTSGGDRLDIHDDERNRKKGDERARLPQHIKKRKRKR